MALAPLAILGHKSAYSFPIRPVIEELTIIMKHHIIKTIRKKKKTVTLSSCNSIPTEIINIKLLNSIDYY